MGVYAISNVCGIVLAQVDATSEAHALAQAREMDLRGILFARCVADF